MKVKVKERVNWPITILLILGLVTVIFPLYLTVVIAFKKPSEMSISGILSLPKSWSFSNFAEAMRVTDFWHSLGNSVLITIITVVLSILIHSMIGYVIGRSKSTSKFYKVAYLYIVSGMFVPFAILMMPLVKQTAQIRIDNIFGVLSCILYADECALIFRLSEKYSDGTGRGCTCRRGNNLENLLERYFPNHETDACNSSGTYSTWYME